MGRSIGTAKRSPAGLGGGGAGRAGWSNEVTQAPCPVQPASPHHAIQQCDDLESQGSALGTPGGSPRLCHSESGTEPGTGVRISGNLNLDPHPHHIHICTLPLSIPSKTHDSERGPSWLEKQPHRRTSLLPLVPRGFPTLRPLSLTLPSSSGSSPRALQGPFALLGSGRAENLGPVQLSQEVPTGSGTGHGTNVGMLGKAAWPLDRFLSWIFLFEASRLQGQWQGHRLHVSGP